MNPVAAAPAHLLPVCAAEDVPMGEGRAVTIAGHRIAVFNTPTGWYALQDACPHRGGPLSDGLVADSCVTCPLHERRFDLTTGEDVAGGEPAIAYAVHLMGDEVLVELLRPRQDSNLRPAD